ncbi:MAG: excinuclease ABC subunit UvrC [Gammaproteobacteria bacterium]|nr:excinuclease ABC subunit UvrC [Gammaproteobacteria bacterium]
MPESAATSAKVKKILQHLSTKPGVYRMLDVNGDILYVGKAKNLSNRVKSYFVKTHTSAKTQLMVSYVEDIATTVCETETEALILENNLIKKHRPRFNVLFRDDKSYPYIFLSKQKFPKLVYHRGAKKQKGDYFGPFPSSTAVRQSLSLMQKTFRVRQCEDSYFANRSRPCLQYQIKRCTAPCVGYISEQDYAEDIQNIKQFYQGKSETVIKKIQNKMERSSEDLRFEDAARYRDQIKNLRHVIQKQVISGTDANLDAVAIEYASGVACVLVLFIRQGQVVGNKSYFPKVPKHTELSEVLETFIRQYYLSDAEVPKTVLMQQATPDLELIQEVVTESQQRKVYFKIPIRGQQKEWLDFAQKNAVHSLRSKLNQKTNVFERLSALQEALELDQMPKHLECFDISHTQGNQTVASCVVFDEQGPKKSDYRIFNISEITKGDDYAAMKQALTRRYKRLLDEKLPLPDLVIVDGGKGQLTQAEEVFLELGIDTARLLGVSKGSDRKVGMEQLWFVGEHRPKILPESSKALHIIQHIRDEAHRFAITKHRQQRKKSATKSLLEEIPGVGAKRRQSLLKHFGGWQEVEKASIKDIAKAPGISLAIAKKIYDYLHG